MAHLPCAEKLSSTGELFRPLGHLGAGERCGALRQSLNDRVRVVDEHDVGRWFGEYLSAFAACGRGEGDPRSLLGYYGIPLLLSTDDGFVALTSDDEIVAAVTPQLDGMQAADYHHSDVLDSEVTVLNTTSAIYRGEFSYVRRDGADMRRLSLSYLVTDGPVGRRISALIVHSLNRS